MTYWKDKLIDKIDRIQDPLILKEVYWLLETGFENEETYKLAIDKKRRRPTVGGKYFKRII